MCEKCRALHLRHRACDACGFYRGKEAVAVAVPALKKSEKPAKALPAKTEEKKEKEAAKTKKKTAKTSGK